MNRIWAYYAHEMSSGDCGRTADYIGRLGVTHSGSLCISWPSWIAYLKGTFKRPPALVYLEQRTEFSRSRAPLGGLDFRHNNDVKTMASPREVRLILLEGKPLPYASVRQRMDSAKLRPCPNTVVPPLRLNLVFIPRGSTLAAPGGRARR